MQHSQGHKHAFIKNGRIAEIHIFDESAHDSDLLNDVKTTFNHDDIVCLCWWLDQGNTVEPQKYWAWDGKTFTEPTVDDLYNLGVVSMNSEMIAAAQAAAKAAQENSATTN